MLACKKPDLYTTFSGMLVIISCMLFVPVSSQAQSLSEITIDHITGSVNQTMLNVNADISYQLSKETIDALDHGVPLEFDIKFRIKKQRKWLWDETIINKSITYRIEYQPLSGQYLVTGLHNGDIDLFQNLEDVLGFIGKLRDVPLIGIDMISENHDYVAQIKSALNIQALPAPLRPLAYISSHWHLSSSWQTWAISL